MVAGAFHVLRQLRHPREWRIAPAGELCSPKLVRHILEMLEKAGEPSEGAEDFDAFLLEVANEVWRLERRVGKLPESEAIRFKAVLFKLKKAVEKLGIQYEDYEGREYDPDFFWDEVLGGGVEEGRAIIKAMRKPRISRKGVILQKGVIVVGKEGE